MNDKSDSMIDAAILAASQGELSQDVQPLYPHLLLALRDKLTDVQKQRSCLVLSSGAFNAVLGNKEFHNLIDPVTRHERLLVGEIGSCLGLPIYSDAYRHPDHKILPVNSLYVVAGDNSVAYGTLIDGTVTAITVEEARSLKARLKEINSVAFDKILWLENGEPVEISDAVRENWNFIGLKNAEFVSSHLDKKKASH